MANAVKKLKNDELITEVKKTTTLYPLKWEDAPDYLKPQEAAKLLRVGKNKIYEWAAMDGFPKIQTGYRVYVIPKEDFRKWIEMRYKDSAERLAGNL